jgi:hypothetical protein
MTVCSKCHRPKEDVAYKWCFSCREYNREYRARNRSKIQSQRVDLRGTRKQQVDSLKASTPCQDCGRHFAPICMDFDHLSDKSMGIAKMYDHSITAILAEIAKCEVVCACCHRTRTVKRSTRTPRTERGKARINTLKKSPCVDCGETWPPEAMDFDHVRGEKTASIANLGECSWERVQEEIAKCDLVCANCHRVRTQGRL